MPFATPVDIANRALQHVGARRILSLTDNSKQAQEINFCYDKLRRAELRRSVWRFATRRAMLRPITPTSERIIPGVWSNVVNYSPGQIVMDTAGTYWIAVFPTIGQTPGGVPPTGFPAIWQQYFGPVIADVFGQTPYNAGELVIASGNIYFSILNNLTVGPINTGWQLLPTPQTEGITLLEPAGPSLSVAGRARNIFKLPLGYLRMAAVDPKVESTEVLGTSGAMRFLDWQFEGDAIISSSTAPLLLRFVADVQDVQAMDDLFCELLAARIAYEICEPLTQSNVKLQAVAAAYQKFAKDARLINWLETGTTEPQEEEYELTKGPAGVQEAASGREMPQIGG